MYSPGDPFIMVAPVVTSWAVAGQRMGFLHMYLQTRVTLEAFPVATPRGRSSSSHEGEHDLMLTKNSYDAWYNIDLNLQLWITKSEFYDINLQKKRRFFLIIYLKAPRTVATIYSIHMSNSMPTKHLEYPNNHPEHSSNHHHSSNHYRHSFLHDI